MTKDRLCELSEHLGSSAPEYVA